MRAPSDLSSLTFALIATLVLAFQPAAVAAATPKGRTAKTPDSGALVEREAILRRTDTTGAARAELRAVRGWFVLAGWLGEEGKQVRRRRVLELAELKLNLAQRLVTLAQLKAEVKRLRRALARTKGSIVKTNEKLKQRGAYLNLLRTSR